jgi:hypothetical protein
MRSVVVLVALVLASSGCTFGLGDYDTSEGPRDYGSRDGTEQSVDGTEPEDDAPPAPKESRKASLGASHDELTRTIQAPPALAR